MSALDQAACVLAAQHPSMWACTTCGYRAEHAPSLDATRPVHACPPRDSTVTLCCGRTPFELPPWDRLATDPSLVTCEGPRVPAARSATPDPDHN